MVICPRGLHTVPIRQYQKLHYHSKWNVSTRQELRNGAKKLQMLEFILHMYQIVNAYNFWEASKRNTTCPQKKRTKYKLGFFEYQTIYGNICEELYRCTETITNTWTNSVPFWSLSEIVSIYYQIHSLRTLVASFRFISFFCIILYPFNPFAAHHSIILIKFLMKYLNHLPIFNAIHLGMEFLKPLISSFL